MSTHLINLPVLLFLTHSIDDIDASTLKAFPPTPKYNNNVLQLGEIIFIID